MKAWNTSAYWVIMAQCLIQGSLGCLLQARTKLGVNIHYQRHLVVQISLDRAMLFYRGTQAGLKIMSIDCPSSTHVPLKKIISTKMLKLWAGMKTAHEQVISMQQRLFKCIRFGNIDPLLAVWEIQSQWIHCFEIFSQGLKCHTKNRVEWLS